jgi:hypothetical protein
MVLGEQVEWRELLSPEEVRDLGCVSRDKQCAKLRSLGVPFMRDGSLGLVSRFHIREWPCGRQFGAKGSGVRLDLVK